MSKDLKQWCAKPENNNARLMAELFADGLSYEEIADKFEVKNKTVWDAINKFTPSATELGAYRRKYVRKKLNCKKS